jgi:hypothetical protein
MLALLVSCHSAVVKVPGDQKTDVLRRLKTLVFLNTNEADVG